MHACLFVCFCCKLIDLLRRARLDLIEKIRWDVGVLNPDLNDKLSPTERKYFDDYSALLADYMVAQGLDLTTVSFVFPSEFLTHSELPKPTKPSDDRSQST